MAYLSVGRVDDAEKLFRVALEIRSEVFGQDHLEVVQSLENLGAVYWYRYEFERHPLSEKP